MFVNGFHFFRVVQSLVVAVLEILYVDSLEASCGEVTFLEAELKRKIITGNTKGGNSGSNL